MRLNTGKDNAANVGVSVPSSAPAKTSCPVVITSVAIFGIAVITAHCSYLHANRFFVPSLNIRTMRKTSVMMLDGGMTKIDTTNANDRGQG